MSLHSRADVAEEQTQDMLQRLARFLYRLPSAFVGGGVCLLKNMHSYASQDALHPAGCCDDMKPHSCPWNTYTSPTLGTCLLAVLLEEY